MHTPTHPHTQVRTHPGDSQKSLPQNLPTGEINVDQSSYDVVLQFFLLKTSGLQVEGVTTARHVVGPAAMLGLRATKHSALLVWALVNGEQTRTEWPLPSCALRPSPVQTHTKLPLPRMCAPPLTHTDTYKSVPPPDVCSDPHP